MKKEKYMHHPKTLLRLRNLVAALNHVLLSVDLKSLPGRVREIPNIRTARFYTTSGLLSRPARLDGRRAMYGRKHLLELLAIKRLQMQKKSIREIQDILHGASAAKLVSVANVDSGIVQKAFLKAAQEPSLNYWPRPRTGTVLEQARPSRSLAPSTDSDPRVGGGGVDPAAAVQSYRIARGVYLVVDPSQNRLTAGEIKQRLERTVIYTHE